MHTNETHMQCTNFFKISLHFGFFDFDRLTPSYLSSAFGFQTFQTLYFLDEALQNQQNPHPIQSFILVLVQFSFRSRKKSSQCRRVEIILDTLCIVYFHFSSVQRIRHFSKVVTQGKMARLRSIHFFKNYRIYV